MRVFVLLFLLVLVPGFPAAQGSQPKPAGDPQFGRQRNQADEERRMERELEKRYNKDRQANLKRDTDRLLTLATELKDYVDKSNEDVLSLDVVRKAEEIEKLAHQVKEKMKH